MLIHPIPISQTASGGAWSFNTTKFSGAELRQIIVIAALATTTFDFTITDADGVVVYDTAERGLTPTGTLNESVNLPLRGIYTLAVSGASVATSTFTGKLMVKEEKK